MTIKDKTAQNCISKQRLVGLDLFRIAAAMSVLCFHSVIHIGCNYGLLQPFFGMGAIMMTGFFMLSGFSLSYSYSMKDFGEWGNIKNFYKKRVVGILPAYYFVAIVYIFTLGSETVIQNLLLLPIEVLGLQSVFSTLCPVTHNGGTWFISCILISYILFPFFMEIVKQMKVKEKVVSLGICMFVLLQSPIVVWKFNLENIYSNPFFRVLEFYIGMVLASMMNEMRANDYVRKYLLSIQAIIIELLILIFGVTLAVKLHISVGNYMLYSWICLPLFVIMLPALALIKIPETKIISYMSSISYGFFLAQLFIWPIMRWIVRITGIENNIFKIVVSFVVCAALATMIHELIEKPSKKIFLKERKENAL